MSKNIKLNNTNYNGVSTVQLPTTDGGNATFKDVDEITTPSGTKTITENGTYDVSGYASANVNVESGGGSDEFIGIKYSGFTGDYNTPTVADARSLPLPAEEKLRANLNLMYYMFASMGVNPNNGYHVKLTDVYLPDGMIHISPHMFAMCAKLTNIHGDFTTIESIGANAFNKCTSLTEVPYMPNLDAVYPNAFNGCTGLTNFKFYKKPTTLGATAFDGCTGITDIYVPWAENEVTDAPWGATNATVHYNTTYDSNHNPVV